MLDNCDCVPVKWKWQEKAMPTAGGSLDPHVGAISARVLCGCHPHLFWYFSSLIFFGGEWYMVILHNSSVKLHMCLCTYTYQGKRANTRWLSQSEPRAYLLILLACQHLEISLSPTQPHPTLQLQVWDLHGFIVSSLPTEPFPQTWSFNFYF